MDEKSTISSKLTKTKTQLKEVQQSFNTQLLTLEREKAILREKIKNFENKSKGMGSKHVD